MDEEGTALLRPGVSSPGAPALQDMLLQPPGFLPLVYTGKEILRFYLGIRQLLFFSVRKFGSEDTELCVKGHLGHLDKKAEP